MVTKKTSIDENTKVLTPAVKKTASAVTPKTLEKKVTAKTANEKAPMKTAEKKAPAKKAAKKTASVSAAPATANQDVVASVLDIKAKNEAKKAAKGKNAKVNAASSLKTETVELKGARAASAKNKRDAVKESAQKAEAKKFKAVKEQTEQTSKCSGCCLLGFKTMIGAWAGAYRKIFDYKTRSSRYDFWAYALVNLIVSLFITIPYRNAMFSGVEMSMTMQIAYWAILFVMTFVALALIVRRLHDMGKSGWKGFFAPLTYSSLGLVALTAIASFVIPDDANPQELTSITDTVLGIGALILLLVNFYYLCKTFIAASFMEGEAVENAYGLPIFADDCTKDKVLRYASLYVVIFTIYMVIVLTALYYLSMVMLMGGRGIY